MCKNVRSLRWKFNPWHAFEVYFPMTQCFPKHHNNLINLIIANKNIVISHSFMGFLFFLKIPLKIIFRFGENNVLDQIYNNINFIDIIFFWGGGGSTWFILHFSLTIHKNGKIPSTRTWLILKSNFASFSSINVFPWVNNETSYENERASLIFLRVIIVVLIVGLIILQKYLNNK